MITLPTPSTDTRHLLVRFFSGLRHPVRWLRDLTGDEPIYPLLVLFGLNAVDELDRTAFGILLPEHPRGASASTCRASSRWSPSSALVRPAARRSRSPTSPTARTRVRLALIGASIWALFSVGTGLAVGVLMLGLVRSGSGIGKAVVDPTHNSLIADYYAVEHAAARCTRSTGPPTRVGQFLGPLIAGLLAFYGASGSAWRVALPFFVFAIPTVVFVVAGLKLQEPVRGAQERRAMGASEERDRRPRSSRRRSPRRGAWSGRSRRCAASSSPCRSSPRRSSGSSRWPALLYEEVFDLDERAPRLRGRAVEPFQLVGLHHRRPHRHQAHGARPGPHPPVPRA